MFPAPSLIWIMAIKPDGDNPLSALTYWRIYSPRVIWMIPFSGCRQIKDYPPLYQEYLERISKLIMALTGYSAAVLFFLPYPSNFVQEADT